MTKKTLLITCAVASLLGVLNQSTVAAPLGSYLGAQVGQGNTHYDGHRQGPAHDKTLAGRVFAGYQFNESLGAEIGFSHFGNTEFRHINGNGHGSIDEYAYDLVATIGVPILDKADIYLKGGAAYIRALRHGNLSGASQVGRVTPTFGIGANLNNYVNIPVFIEWNRIQGNGPIKNADLVSLGLAVHFDRPAYQEPVVAERGPATLTTQMEGTGVEVVQEGEYTKLTIPSKISFDYNKATIKPGFYPALDKIVSYLNDHPNTEAKLVGHTDSVGSRAFNQKLSERRAASVAQYLESHDVDQNRLKVSGRSKDQPVASNATEEGRAKNRRVEMILHDA